MWLDEAGQKKFRLESWEAIRRRLSIFEGRALITTTPYSLGWLKQRLWDPWKEAGGNHPEIDIIRFDSTENPAFPPEEFERPRNSMPRWKFDLFYRAIFTRPAGLIYDSFDPDVCKVKRFKIPDHWPRYLGLDFGGVNTGGVFYAEEMRNDGTDEKPKWTKTGKLFAYRRYKAGGRTAKQHADALLRGEPRLPIRCVGGSKSEDQWRKEFATAGFPVGVPDQPDVEVGIGRVYGAHKANEIFVFDDLHGYLEELATYSRVVDDAGNVGEVIEDKSTFHFMDASRYILAWWKLPKMKPDSYRLEMF